MRGICISGKFSICLSFWTSTFVFAQSTNHGIWISHEEIATLPISGPAWDNLKSKANEPAGTPDVSNQDDDVNVRVLAKALVYARTGEETYRNEVIHVCMTAIGTESGGRTLALGRELIAYVIAADLVKLPADKDQQFRAWLRQSLIETLNGRTLQSTHEDRPNNWGTHAGGSRAAVAVYLGDQTEIERTAQVLKGWLGGRSSYVEFKYGDLSWQADPNTPVGINPKGSTKEGHSIDGVLPDDQRRGGGFSWPPPKANYVYEALQGILAQAIILSRVGYDVWNWEDQAILRAFEWLHNEANFSATGDDTWQPHVVNFYYGTHFPAPVPANPGKNVGWTDWTHMENRGNPEPPTTIRGVVINSATRGPVENAAVQLKVGAQMRHHATSNSVGQYMFLNIEAGTYNLEASKNGFAPNSIEVTVVQSQQLFGLNISLTPVADNTAPDPPKNVRVALENP